MKALRGASPGALGQVNETPCGHVNDVPHYASGPKGVNRNELYNPSEFKPERRKSN